MEYIINSNDGWQTVKFIMIEKIEIKNKPYIKFNLSFEGKYWDKKDVLNDEFNELILDKVADFKQVIISEKKWNKFISNVNDWKLGGHLFSTNLHQENGEYVDIDLVDTHPNIIASAEKPVMSFNLKDSRSSFEFNMIIDGTSFKNNISNR